ncbi:MAG: hypothetical protein GVY02_07745, partial [Bacteroidetes bacterium]|nr:hypothetical protein [Bacteroidota bacterium]
MLVLLKQWLRSFTFSILVIAAGSSLSAQQVVLEDDFEDEDITSNPEWTGDLANFTTIDESGNKILRLSAPDGGSSVLTTPSTTTQGVWDLFYRFGFAPSGSNRTRIFLMADTDDLDGSVNGYAISIGESGGDPFRLIRYDNGSETEILASTTEVSAGQGYQVRVTRDDTGAWELLIGTGYGSTPVSEAGPVTDATHQSSSHFGFLLDYTSTRTEAFFFDDIQVQNSEPFEVVGATIA